MLSRIADDEIIHVQMLCKSVFLNRWPTGIFLEALQIFLIVLKNMMADTHFAKCINIQAYQNVLTQLNKLMLAILKV